MNTLDTLYNVIQTRRSQPQEGSYTCYLLDKGLDKILKKVGEESAEVIIAAKNPSCQQLVQEVADLLYHLQVMLSVRDIPWKDVDIELMRRAEKIGNLKPMREADKNT
ncbi:MAG: phosphoribosyl-ATP diphosphatase [Oscillospiraceae bacterium]|nr:phosphoribosyl-ATP diphosphatase [Oscillospiraceae bacterium]